MSCLLKIIHPAQHRAHPRPLLQGTADAVRQYAWLFRDIKNRNVEVRAGDGMVYLAGLA